MLDPTQIVEDDVGQRRNVCGDDDLRVSCQGQEQQRVCRELRNWQGLSVGQIDW